MDWSRPMQSFKEGGGGGEKKRRRRRRGRKEGKGEKGGWFLR